MPVDPTIQSLLDSIGRPDLPDLSDLGVDQARGLMEMLSTIGGEPEAVASIVGQTVPGPAGDIQGFLAMGSMGPVAAGAAGLTLESALAG